jgi:hypothetical protein
MATGSQRNESPCVILPFTKGFHHPTLTLPHEGGREFTFFSLGAAALFVCSRNRTTRTLRVAATPFIVGRRHCAQDCRARTVLRSKIRR